MYDRNTHKLADRQGILLAVKGREERGKGGASSSLEVVDGASVPSLNHHIPPLVHNDNDD